MGTFLLIFYLSDGNGTVEQPEASAAFSITIYTLERRQRIDSADRCLSSEILWYTLNHAHRQYMLR
ncbi:MAG: hypothetical protein R3272_09790 [Candidatus Promineifilaceae bacterium]|nr:hypothetical protein [Candidatus Promineifilaceae bacterium]